MKILSPHDWHQCVVVDKTVNQSVFGKTSNVVYDGWTPSYSVQAVLMSLQGFFANPEYGVHIAQYTKDYITPTSIAANEFECLEIGCKHRGIKNMSPDVSLIEDTNKPALHVMEEED